MRTSWPWSDRIANWAIEKVGITGAWILLVWIPGPTLGLALSAGVIWLMEG